MSATPISFTIGSEFQGEFAHRATDGQMAEGLLTRVVFTHVTETPPTVPRPPRHVDGKEIQGSAGFEADLEIALPLHEQQDDRIHRKRTARQFAAEPEPQRCLESEDFGSNAKREPHVPDPGARAVSTITPHIEVMDRHLSPEIDALRRAHRSGQENRPPCESVGDECGALQMACPEMDNGRNAVSARTERPDSRVNIIAPRVPGTSSNRFGSTSIRRRFSNVGLKKIAWSSSQSTARREGSRVGLFKTIRD
jgi:hypothetical protein